MSEFDEIAAEPGPRCRHVKTGSRTRVSSHEDLDLAWTEEEESASADVCRRRACVEDAGQWIKIVTGVDRVYVERFEVES